MKPVYVIILVVVVAAVAFWGGMTYEKSRAPSFAGGFSGQNGRFGGRFGSGQGGFGGGNGGQRMTPINGQIVSSSNNSITVKLFDGSSKIVDLTGQTMINKSSKGTAADLTTGQQVTAFGITNSDGSVTAQAVNVGNGMFRVRQGGERPSGSPSSGQ